ncbi:sensor histidine kinase [Cohnella soli]|uniref:Sensor histidine kinase n=1 Tax=Cohnella soli TaxID=425005 RepID=A0ABW0I1P5_9BACL
MKTNSIVYKFAVSLTLILAILLTVLLVSNIYSLAVVRQNSLNSSRNTLAIYVESIHNYLNICSKDLLEVFENNIDTATEYSHLNESDRYFKSAQWMNALKAKTSNNDSSDGMFIKLPDGGMPLVQFGNRIPSNEKLALADFLNKQPFKPDSSAKLDEWTNFDINGFNYLFKYITYSDISFGVFVKANTLLSIVNKKANDSHYFLSDQDGRVLTSTNASIHAGSTLEELRERFKARSLIISEPIAEFGQMTNMVAKQSVFSGLKLIQWVIISLGIVSVIVIPFVLRYLTRGIINPVLELVKAAKEVEKGQWEYQLPSGRYSMEFTKLFHSFQSMVREITDLKIRTYEEKIERSRTELKYLQMQIRPHFFLNAISTISSLTYQNKNEEIRNLIQLLSVHLRYMFKGELLLIPIREEIKHVENYIRMQEIRYPDQIFYMTDIDPEAEQTGIPQFLIQTFVENVFKHAMIYGEMLSIFIRASHVMEDKRWVKIVIEDNGEGFPKRMPETFERSESDWPDENGNKVGIANIRRTLQLLYKRNDLLKLSNAEPSGARVEIRLPFRDVDINAPGGDSDALPADR